MSEAATIREDAAAGEIRVDRSEVYWAAPSGHVAALVAGFERRVRCRRLLLMLQAYIDDSREDPVATLGGCLSTVDRWMEFSDEWAAALAEAPALAYLKAQEAAALQGAFRGWAPEARDFKLRRLEEVMARHVGLGIFCLLDLRDYEEIIRPYFDPRARPTPYFMLFYRVISTVLNHKKENGLTDQVDYIFDEQGKEPSRIMAVWDEIVALLPPETREGIAGRPIFRDDQNVLPLQAADYVAWHLRKQVVTRKSHLVGPVAGLPCVTTFIGPDEMRECLRSIKAFASRVNREGRNQFFPR